MKGDKDLPQSFSYSDFIRENKNRLLSLKKFDLLGHKLEYVKLTANGKDRIKIGYKATSPHWCVQGGFCLPALASLKTAASVLQSILNGAF